VRTKNDAPTRDAKMFGPPFVHPALTALTNVEQAARRALLVHHYGAGPGLDVSHAGF